MPEITVRGSDGSFRALIVNVSQAPGIVVSPGGNLAAAYSSAKPGDVIRLTAGQWGNVATPTGSKPVTFRADPGAVFGDLSIRSSAATWDGGKARELGITGTVNTVVQNLEVDAGFARVVALYVADTTGTVLRDCRIGNVLNEKGVLLDVRNDDITFERVLVHDVRVNDPNVHNEGMYVNHVRGLTLRDCRFEQCATMDVFVTQSGGGQVSEGFTFDRNVFGRTVKADGSAHFFTVGFHSALGAIRNLTARNNTLELPVNRNGLSGTGIESGNTVPFNIPGVTQQ